jgi:exosome complex component RRP46
MSKNLQILPHLINAAFLGLLSTSIPLETVVISTLVAAQPSGTVTPNPSLQEMEAATSLHVLAYSTQGQLVVVESEGRFDMDTWEAAEQTASKLCLNRTGKESDPMETQESLEAVVRRALEEKISEEEDDEEDDEGEEIGD